MLASKLNRFFNIERENKKNKEKYFKILKLRKYRKIYILIYYNLINEIFVLYKFNLIRKDDLVSKLSFTWHINHDVELQTSLIVYVINFNFVDLINYNEV